MSTSACPAAKLSFSRMLISLSSSCLLILTMLCVASEAQTPLNPAGKTQEPLVAPSPTPTAAPKKTEDEKKPDDATRPKEPMSTPTFNGLRFRSIGPAFTSGRVVGFAVDQQAHLATTWPSLRAAFGRLSTMALHGHQCLRMKGHTRLAPSQLTQRILLRFGWGREKTIVKEVSRMAMASIGPMTEVGVGKTSDSKRPNTLVGLQ